MNITDVRVFPVEEDKLKAYVTITLDHCFVVRDLKVIHGASGLFIAMPAKRRKDGTYKDIAHPLNADTRSEMERIILVGVRADRRTTVTPAADDAAGARPEARLRRFPSGRGQVSSAPMQPARDFKVFAGNSNPELAQRICDYLKRPLGKATVGRFSDGEIHVEIGENVRGQDVFIIQSTCPPANDHLMELLIMCDALKRASAALHQRGDPLLRVRPAGPEGGAAHARSPPSWWRTCWRSAGATRVVSMDMHAGQIQGFFNIPSDHLYALAGVPRGPAQALPGRRTRWCIVSPDAGGVERARAYSKRLNTGLAIIDKRRPRPNASEVMNLIGDVKGKDAVLLDDMVDTAGTLTQAAAALKEKGARRVVAYAVHPDPLRPGDPAHHRLGARGGRVHGHGAPGARRPGVPARSACSPPSGSSARPSPASTGPTRSARSSSERPSGPPGRRAA